MRMEFFPEKDNCILVDRDGMFFLVGGANYYRLPDLEPCPTVLDGTPWNGIIQITGVVGENDLGVPTGPRLVTIDAGGGIRWEDIPEIVTLEGQQMTVTEAKKYLEARTL